MLRRLVYSAFLILTLGLCVSWGFWGHKTINKMAVFTLPPGMIGFYKDNIEYLTDHAPDADKRRYKKVGEAPKHFIDLDHYGKGLSQSVPQSWYKAVALFGKDTLEKYGILPWQINLMTAELTQAFRDLDKDKILYLSANLGHYVADAHVPLHTSENYNGQLTDQIGIHGLWESRIPELFGDKYTFWTGRAKYYDKPQEEAWRIVDESYARLDSVLKIEKQLSKKFSKDQEYAIERKGHKTVKIYSAEYAGEYDMLLNNMAERRMQAGVLAVGSFWYTAWVNAGKPNLNKLRTVKSAGLPVEAEAADSVKNLRPHED